MTCPTDRYTEPLLRYYEARMSGAPDTPELEAEAVAANLGISGAFARRVRGGASIEDVEAAAQLGLINAIRTWTPDGGSVLPSWAHGPMTAEVRRVKVETSPSVVRVPYKTHRAAREISESGEDVDAACKRLGKHRSAVKAAIQIKAVELTPEIGATISIEDSLFRSEMHEMLESASKCWRDNSVDRLAAASEALSQRRAELLSAAAKESDEAKRAELRALADGLWPDSPEGRLLVLSRLDYALTIAAPDSDAVPGSRAYKRQVARTLDVECWRRHYLGGDPWHAVGTWLGGVTRTRAQFRAKRAEAAIVRALAVAARVPEEAMELWARRPIVVTELERLGILERGADPMTVFAAVEDATFEIDELDNIDDRHARAWAARVAGQTWEAIGSLLRVSRSRARTLVSEAGAILRSLLRRDDGPAQLELDVDATDTWTVTVFWSPNAATAVVVESPFVRRSTGRDSRRRIVRPRLSARVLQGQGRPAYDSPAASVASGWFGCTGPPGDQTCRFDSS